MEWPSMLCVFLIKRLAFTQFINEYLGKIPNCVVDEVRKPSAAPELQLNDSPSTEGFRYQNRSGSAEGLQVRMRAAAPVGFVIVLHQAGAEQSRIVEI
jgi:hypothetical protein